MPQPPSNPGWKFGYVPSPGEWNNAFAGKVDYPAPLSQGGTGAFDAAGSNYNLQQRFEVDDPTLAAAPLTVYSLRTDTQAIAVALPPLSACNPGDWILLFDAGANAGINNITVTANAAEMISLNGTASNSFLIRNNGAQCLLTVGSDNEWHGQIVSQSTGIGFAASRIIAIGASTTLDQSYLGALCKVSGLGTAVTLPNSGFIAGNTIAIDNTDLVNPISITIQSNLGDAPTSLQPGSCCIVVADGLGGWWKAAYYAGGNGVQQPVPQQIADAAYTLQAQDAGQYLQFTSNTSVTITVPSNADVPFAVGTVIVFEQFGSGVITLVGETGVTLHGHNGLHSGGQYAVMQIKSGSNASADTWTVLGDTTA